MRKRTLLLSLVCLSSIIGCRGLLPTSGNSLAPAPAPKLEKGWQTLKAKSGRFTLAVPPGWANFDVNDPAFRSAIDAVAKQNPGFREQIQQVMTQNTFDFSAGDARMVGSGFMDNVNVIHRDVKSRVMVDDAFLRGLEEEARKSLPSVKETKADKTKLAVGEVPHLRTEFSMNTGAGDQDLISHQYYMIDGTNVYVVTFTTRPPQEAKLTPTFRKMIDTFRLKS